MLRLENVSFSYDQALVIDQIDLGFAPGKITTVIGPNGSGKSTLLSLASRLLKPQQGIVLLKDVDIHTLKAKTFAQEVAVLAQNPWVPSMQVEELVMAGRYPYQSWLNATEENDREIVRAAMAMTHCEEFKAKAINRLSGGERQRVFLAMALAQNTDIILLDEPTTFLDIHIAYEILELITKLNQNLGKTIVMVLHDLNMALRYSDQVILLQKGKVILQDEPNQLLACTQLQEVFSIEVKSFYEEGKPYYFFDPIEKT